MNVSVKAVLELLSGDADSVKAEAENWVRSMFSYGDDPDIPRFSIGRDVVRDRLASGLVSIAGVKRVRWESPDGGVEIPAGGLAVLEALTCKRSGWRRNRPWQARSGNISMTS